MKIKTAGTGGHEMNRLFVCSDDQITAAAGLIFHSTVDYAGGSLLYNSR